MSPDDLFSAKEIYALNGVTLTSSKQSSKQMMQRNSEIKKPVHCVVGYLAGVTAISSQLNNRPMSNSSKCNQMVSGAFGAGIAGGK